MSCVGCPRQWTGYTECHCARCHRHFGSLAGFDAHLGKDGLCSDPPLVTGKGKPAFKLIDRKSGPVWVGAREGTNPAWITPPGTALDRETAL